MCRSVLTLLILNIVIVDLTVSAPSVSFVPTKTDTEDLESKLSTFLSDYYDKFVKDVENVQEKSSKNVDIYDTMQGDQPTMENNINQGAQILPANATYQGDSNMSNPEYVKVMREM